MFELVKRAGGKFHLFESFENKSGSLKKYIFFTDMQIKKFIVTEQRENNIRRFTGIEEVSELSLRDIKYSVKRSLLN
ncbi:hypothetical protein [Photobacterium damselae]